MKKTILTIGTVFLRLCAIWLLEAVYLGQFIDEQPISCLLEITILCFFICLLCLLLWLEQKVVFHLLPPSVFSTVMSIIDFGFAASVVIFCYGVCRPVWSKDWDGMVIQIAIITLRMICLYRQNRMQEGQRDGSLVPSSDSQQATE